MNKAYLAKIAGRPLYRGCSKVEIEKWIKGTKVPANKSFTKKLPTAKSWAETCTFTDGEGTAAILTIWPTIDLEESYKRVLKLNDLPPPKGDFLDDQNEVRFDKAFNLAQVKFTVTIQ